MPQMGTAILQTVDQICQTSIATLRLQLYFNNDYNDSILSDLTFLILAVSRRSGLTSSGVYLRGLASAQHSSKKTSQQWRAVGYTWLATLARFDLPGI